MFLSEFKNITQVHTEWRAFIYYFWSLGKNLAFYTFYHWSSLWLKLMKLFQHLTKSQKFLDIDSPTAGPHQREKGNVDPLPPSCCHRNKKAWRRGPVSMVTSPPRVTSEWSMARKVPFYSTNKKRPVFLNGRSPRQSLLFGGYSKMTLDTVFRIEQFLSAPPISNMIFFRCFPPPNLQDRAAEHRISFGIRSYSFSSYQEDKFQLF